MTMRRFASLMLCFCLLCSLFGCGQDLPEPIQLPTAAPTQMPETLPEETMISTEPMVQFQLPLIAASTALIEENFTAPDGTVLLQYTYQDLVLTIEDPHVADAVTMDFLNLVDPAGPSASKILQDAKKDYDSTNNWTGYQFKRLYAPMRLDKGILSMYGIQVISGGITTASSAGISVTYDLLTGQRLSLKQVLQDDYSASALAQAIADALIPSAEAGILYSDYTYGIAEMFSTNAPIENWYLSDQGLCFYFAPYEIAPYSAGTIVATVSYDRLSGILKDVYFPEESIVLTGNLFAVNFAQAQLGNFTQFAELIVDSQGTECLLYTSGAVDHLRIEIGTWHKDGSFTPEATVFSASTLGYGDAILIQLADSKIGNIRIAYHSGGNAYSIPLSSILSFG